jgi:hypothetical protein
LAARRRWPLHGSERPCRRDNASEMWGTVLGEPSHPLVYIIISNRRTSHLGRMAR